MGGMATVFKNRPMPSRLVADMHIYGNSSSSADTNSTAMTTQRPWKWMKMAFGENPKRVYGSTDRIPTTRMGHAWLMRKEFQRARALMRAQDRWCMRRMRVDNDDEKEDFRRESSRVGEADEEFPVDLALQTLVELLRGEVKLNVHVYTVGSSGRYESLPLHRHVMDYSAMICRPTILRRFSGSVQSFNFRLPPFIMR